MKIALIGCGWLGLPLGQKLKEKGHEIFGSTTSNEKLHFIEEMGIKSFLYDGMDEVKFPADILNVECLIVNFPPSKSMNYSEQIKFLLEQFPNSCKVIFTSSTSVYKDVENDIDETAEIKMDHPVVMAEEEIRKCKKNATILRLAGLIGANRHPIKFLSSRIMPDGNAAVNLVQLDDVIAAIEKVIEKNAWNKTFNVCWPEHPSRVTYYTTSAQKFNIPAPKFELSDKRGKRINGSKIIEELDFQYKNTI